MRRQLPQYNTNEFLQRHTREAELRKLPLSAQRIARPFGVDCATARLLASLVGIDAGDHHE